MSSIDYILKQKEDIDELFQLDDKVVKLSENVLYSENKRKICLVGSQTADSNDEMKSDHDNTETNREDKEKCDFQSADDGNIIDDGPDKGTEIIRVKLSNFVMMTYQPAN